MSERSATPLGRTCVGGSTLANGALRAAGVLRSVVAPGWFHLVDVEVLVDVVRARNVVGLWWFDACEGIDEFVERRIVGKRFARLVVEWRFGVDDALGQVFA